jgi:C4-dicarboxylate-specific signal transduction histidine kinase
MSEARVDRIGQDGLAFMGKIMAGQSHEVTNVLNIINELSGLQQDVLLSADPDSPASLSKLQKVCGKIQFQVERGERIVRNMNLFAHSTDTPTAVFELKEVVSRIVFFAERWARLKRVELTAALPDEATALTNDSFRLQHAIFVGIEAALLSATDRRHITVGYAPAEGGAEIVIDSADAFQQTPEVRARLSLLSLISSELGGSMRAHDGAEESHRLTFFVPRNREEALGDDSKRDRGA